MAGKGVEGEELGGGEEGGGSLVDGEGHGLLVGAGPLVCGGRGEPVHHGSDIDLAVNMTAVGRQGTMDMM